MARQLAAMSDEDRPRVRNEVIIFCLTGEAEQSNWADKIRNDFSIFCEPNQTVTVQSFSAANDMILSVKKMLEAQHALEALASMEATAAVLSGQKVSAVSLILCDLHLKNS